MTTKSIKLQLGLLATVPLLLTTLSILTSKNAANGIKNQTEKPLHKALSTQIQFSDAQAIPIVVEEEITDSRTSTNNLPEQKTLQNQKSLTDF